MTVEKGHAYFSADMKYRYALQRVWGTGPRMLFIGLNPSTADEAKLDPTLRRVVHFAMREGCGGMWVGNAFAFRSTQPVRLRTTPDPVGPENDNWLKKLAGYCQGHIVVGWGTHGTFRERDAEVRDLLELYEIRCWGQTKDGHPRHPLYLRGDTPLVPYVPAVERAAT